MNIEHLIKPDDVVPYVLSLFETSCIKQFESINRKITRIETPGLLSGERRAAFISSGNEDMKVSLLLCMSKSTLKNTMPSMGDLAPNLGEELLQDWLHELCNRLLGRLKNKLLDHNCSLRMGLPQACPEHYLGVLQNEPGQKICEYYELDGEVIECHLCVNQLNPDMVMEQYEDEDEDWFDESELQHL